MTPDRIIPNNMPILPRSLELDKKILGDCAKSLNPNQKLRWASCIELGIYWNAHFNLITFDPYRICRDVNNRR